MRNARQPSAAHWVDAKVFWLIEGKQEINRTFTERLAGYNLIIFIKEAFTVASLLFACLNHFCVQSRIQVMLVLRAKPALQLSKFLKCASAHSFYSLAEVGLARV